MSQAETIARPYAKAVYQQAKAEDKVQAWQDFLKVASLVAGSGEVNARLSVASFFEQLEKWLDDSLQQVRHAGLSIEEKNFLKLLYQNSRLHVLPEIVRHYESFALEAENVCRARVFTALPLTEKEQENIRVLIEKKAGRKVVLEIQEQAELLAGVRIEYDGLVIDQTTKGQIDRFARKLEELRN